MRARVGFEMLAPSNLFAAFIAGLHHQLQDHPYGVDLDEVSPFPISDELRTSIWEMVLLVSTADYYDALTTRGGTKSYREVEQVMMMVFGNADRIEWLFDHDYPMQLEIEEQNQFLMEENARLCRY